MADPTLPTIPARLAARAMEMRDRPALTLVGTGDLTYSGWDRRSDAAARGLQARGVRPHWPPRRGRPRRDRVVILAEQSSLLSFAVAYVAVQKAGGTPVPVTRAAGLDHLKRVLAASGAVGLIGAVPPAGFDGWSAELADLVLDGSPSRRRPAVKPDHPAEILYTSGTTGEPKGVVVSHENLLYTHHESATDHPVRTVVHALSPGTQVGQGLLLQSLDGRPHHIVALPAFDAYELLAAVDHYHAAQLVMVPRMALELVERGVPEGLDLSSLKLLRSTSAPITPATLAQLAAMFPNARIENHYSTSELWPRRARMFYDPEHPGSVGRNGGPAEIRIVDDAGVPLPPGEPGLVEMRLVGAPLRHYLADADNADGTYQPGGWGRSGDVGRLDDKGYLYLLDRVGDTINTGGIKIDSLAAERVIAEFPGVDEVAVVGLPSPTLGEYPVAAIRAAVDLDLDALAAFLAEQLGTRAPKRLLLVNDFPRTGLGKIIKRELRQTLAAAQGPAPDVDDDDPLLSQLRTIWDAALPGVVAVNQDFARLGGDSVSGAKIVARVRKELGRHITHRALYEAADLPDFAERVRNAPPWESDELGPIGPAEPTPDTD